MWKKAGIKIIALGGFIGWLIGLLGFFGVSFKELCDVMTTHYVLLLFSLVSFAVFIWALYQLWKSTRITPENIRTKLRGWLDDFGYSYSVASPTEGWHWGLYRYFCKWATDLRSAHQKAQ